jgi:NADPH:quinone reductase
MRDAPRGRIVVMGSRGDVTITSRDLMLRRASIHALALWASTEAGERQIHALRPVAGKQLPLADAALGHQEILEPGAYGKIVLVP